MNKYFQKYHFQPIKIEEPVSPDLGIIVVIPCYNETTLIDTLNSLNQCDKPKKGVEVIVVINQSEVVEKEIAQQNSKTYNEALGWKKEVDTQFNLHFLFEKELPKKHAGVGLARKIGMDEAVMRFDKADNTEGIIVCLDADCKVSKDYLVAIENHFNDYPKTPGCSIRFEHPVEGIEYPEENYLGIINYELFLRYYNLGLRYIDLPYGYHTVGSSMAIKTWAYQKQGGMNRRKAGEDFYFLHKIIALGNFSELNECCVYPSPRTSDRVPFGTGKAINDFINQSSKEEYLTYDVTIFEVLKSFVLDIEEIYKSKTYIFKHEVLVQFFLMDNFQETIDEIKANTTSYDSFIKRFFVYFDAFKVLKLVHYLRDNFYPNKEIKEEVKKLLKKMEQPLAFDTFNKTDLLFALREIERNRNDTKN